LNSKVNQASNLKRKAKGEEKKISNQWTIRSALRNGKKSTKGKIQGNRTLVGVYSEKKVTAQGKGPSISLIRKKVVPKIVL